MHFVPVKSAEQQAQALVLKVRETLVDQRTALINTLRGHAIEFGIIAGKGLSNIALLLKKIEAETAIPSAAQGPPWRWPDLASQSRPRDRYAAIGLSEL
jgi:transposase